MTLDREEFRDAMRRVYETSDAGFQAINDRLDLLNGRIGKGEVADAEIRARVVSLEKEVFQRPRRRADDQADVDQRGGFTKREGAIATVALTLIYVLLRLLELLGTKFVSLVTK